MRATADPVPIIPAPVDAAKIARWLEAVDAAIDNPPECVDVLLDLADSLETAWLALCDREAAS